MEEVIVRLIDMPTAIKGISSLDEDGNFNIYINARLSQDMQTEAYQHEMAHLKRGDHYRTADIRDKEFGHL